MPDCPSKSECSDANASGVLVLSFQFLKNDVDTGESFPPRRVTATLGTNVRGVTHDGESFTPLAPALPMDPHFRLVGQDYN